MAPRAGPPPRNAFWAMLLVVSCWSFAPLLLMLCCVGVAAPHGLLLQLVLIPYTFLGFCGLFKFHQHVCLVSVPAALAAAAPPGWSRLVAAVSVALILVYGWCATGPEPWQPRPPVYQFIREWGRQWFAEAELRGELPEGCTTKCCFAFHPHGIISYGFSFNGVFNGDFEKAGRTNWIILFRLRYCVPPFRWLMDALWSDRLRVHDATKSTVKTIMEAGENLAIVAGGASETSAYEYGKDSIVMRRQKGLIKYCLQHGYRIFPIYTFGESTTYSSLDGLRGLRLAIVRATGVPPTLFWGWPWLPVMPRTDSRLITYIGDALELPHIEEPAAEQLDHWHGKYLEALKKLFDEKRGEAGYPDAELEVL